MTKINIDTEYNKNIELAAHKLAPIFALYGWTWGDTGIPTATDIEEHLKEAIEGLIDRGIDWSSSGRILVRKLFDGQDQYINICLEIEDVYQD